MHMIHLKDAHMPKGANLFALSIGEIVCFGLALFFFVISWLESGSANMENLGGVYTLAVLLLGVVAGVVLAVLTKPKEDGQS